MGKDAVDAAKKRTAFADKYAAVLGKLTAKERDAVTASQQMWAREDARLRAEMASLSRRIRSDAVRAASGKKKKDKSDDTSAMDDAPVDDFPLLDEVEDAEERALYAEAMAAVDAGEEDDSADSKEAGKKNSVFEKLPKLGGGVGSQVSSTRNSAPAFGMGSGTRDQANGVFAPGFGE